MKAGVQISRILEDNHHDDGDRKKVMQKALQTVKESIWVHDI
jgi:hypothetical protein